MYPHYTVPIILPAHYNYYPHVPSLHSPYHFTCSVQLLPPCTPITQSLSFYLLSTITTPMYPHRTVPIILPGLYNYYPPVPPSHSPYHSTYTFAVLSFITIYPSFKTLYHLIQVGLLQFNPCPYRLSSTNNLIRSH